MNNTEKPVKTGLILIHTPTHALAGRGIATSLCGKRIPYDFTRSQTAENTAEITGTPWVSCPLCTAAEIIDHWTTPQDADHWTQQTIDDLA
ncbi:hypothetical protein [Bifidobacterium simiarum]|uniref:hypothetical protein n=1 Tax=Bifidobacterium simiarum TaxID=2045441 RepID=UPI001BDD95FB|nr:hypothetical protein [Bifidobacterium simiarum]MBT1167010.1 hypothetical protein [Bifidobacterium simiarum]